MWVAAQGSSAILAVSVSSGPTGPGTPSQPVVANGDSQVRLSWSAPTFDGGSPITGYTVSASPGPAGCSTSGERSCLVSGLADGTTYSFRVTATNAVGTGAASTPSVPIVVGPGVVVSRARGTISHPAGIAAGPDGNLWFTNTGDNSIGRITPAGAVSSFTDTSIHDPTGIAAGPDGNLWFTNSTSDSIGRITPAGAVSSFTDASIHDPTGIAAGPDGNLWFTNSTSDSIGRITPAGAVSSFTGGFEGPTSITAGPAGAMWFTSHNTTDATRSIGRITTSGVVTVFVDPSWTPSDQPDSIVSGPDGALWFTDTGVGRITTAGAFAHFNDASVGSPTDIAPGPDGNLWYTTSGGTTVGSITTAGVATLYTDTAFLDPQGIVAGPDQAMWFTDSAGNAIGRVTTEVTPSVSSQGKIGPLAFRAGGFMHYTDPSVSGPLGVTTGPDGALWYTNSDGDSIGRISPTGVVSSFNDPSIDAPSRIASGPDGALWFTNTGNDSIGRITTAGVVSNFSNPSVSSPQAITAGPAGNLWFTNTGNDSIGRITPTGVVTNFSNPSVSSPQAITAGPAGNLWFTNTGNDSIGRITPTGVVTNFSDPSINAPTGIAPGPDGALWFTNSGNDSIGRITTSGVVTNFTDPSIDVPSSIAGGPDGALWFTNLGAASGTYSLGKITTGGAVSRYLVVALTGEAQGPPGSDGITADPRGQMWFADSVPQLIGSVATASPPGPPTAVTAVVGDARATVSWSAPDIDGGAAVTGYAVTASPGGQTCATTTGMSCVVSGLTNATSYTFTVTATNSVGTSPASSPSTPVTPVQPAGSYFHALAPARVLDSRPGPGNTGGYTSPWSTGTTRTVAVGGHGGVPSDAEAVVLNVTVADTTGGSYLTLWPTGQTQPTASNLNWTPGEVIPNAVTVKLGDNGAVSVFNQSGHTDVIIDVAGYYDTTTGDGFTPLAPARILDSRPGAGNTGGYTSPWSTGTTRTVAVAGHGGVPTDAEAVVLNVTVADTTGGSYLTLWPTGQTQPTASNLNWTPGEVIPNAVTVKLGDNGAVSVFNQSGHTDVIIDVAGYYQPGTGKLFHPLTPARILDSRPGAGNTGGYTSPWSTGTTRTVAVAGHGGVPTDAKAVVSNVTVADTTGGSYLTLWPTGQTQPTASNLNWTPGEVIPNAVTVKLGDNGAISVFNQSGHTDVIADVAGWYG